MDPVVVVEGVGADQVERAPRRRPPITFMVVTGVAAAVLLVSRSGPGRGTYNGLVTIAVLLLPVVAATWLVGVARAGTSAGRAPSSERRLLVAAPLLLALTIVPLAVSGVPSAVRWQLSRSAFDDVIAHQPRPPSDRYHHAALATPAWIGSYKVRSVEIAEDLTVFFEDEDAVFDPFREPGHGDRRGFVHTGSANLSLFDLDGSPELRPLGDGWYTFQAASITGH